MLLLRSADTLRFLDVKILSSFALLFLLLLPYSEPNVIVSKYFVSHLLEASTFCIWNNNIMLFPLWDMFFPFKSIFSYKKIIFRKLFQIFLNDVFILKIERCSLYHSLGHNMIFQKVIWSVLFLGKHLFSVFILTVTHFLSYKTISHGRELYMKLNIYYWGMELRTYMLWSMLLTC